MKVLISYPPISSIKGCCTLGQNRQFQYFKEPTYIYPVVPAQAATLLKQAGHEVIWNDSIAQEWSYERFLDFIRAEQPDLIAFETKTPVVKLHWKIINEIKGLFSGGETRPTIALFGDHVTALPEESMQNCDVDFILTGGDYDFLLSNLCNSLEKLPVTDYRLLITELEPGIWYRDNLQIKNTGPFKLNHDLNTLPFIDRDLTRWPLYAFKNGNFKRTPGTYVMSGRDCWYHACTYCSWPTLYPEFRARNVENVLDEIGELIAKYQIREIMDDTGCFPVGGWLREFCHGFIKRGFHKKVYLDCNVRFGSLTSQDFSLMKKANFRLLLFGLESANQKTLDRVNKNLKVEKIAQDTEAATRAGLFPHISIMFGYPWESYADALETFNLGRRLLKKGLAYTLQATLVIPYPGTPLFEQCKQGNLLRTVDWDDYDMKQPVIKTSIPQEQLMQLIQGMYRVSFDPEFILRRISSVRDKDDLLYDLRAAKKVFGHILDFRKEAKQCLGH
ncbi:MAG: radical SAM protein [Candidatus Omnitrophota bacterium]